MRHDIVMHALFRYLRHTKSTPTLIEVRISREALLDNYTAFKEAYALPVAPVLKSNAYGHGLLQVAHVLEKERPPFFVVDSYYEAKMLRHAGSTAPILVVGYVPAESIAANKVKNVSFVLTSVEHITRLIHTNSKATVHIKLDTGMRRQGLLPSEIVLAIEILKKSNLVVEGICSHFASADDDAVFTGTQIELWNSLIPVWKEAFTIRFWHIAASAGSAYTPHIDSNMVRLGAGLYGFERIPSRAMPLQPVLSIHSIVTLVKELSVGESVGYNRTFTADKPLKIATVPVGYFEGMDRRLSNIGCMQIGGVVCPIVGRISMNMSVIDVTACKDVRIETPVLVLSGVTEDKNSLFNLSLACDMSPLEFAVHIPQHLRRVVG